MLLLQELEPNVLDDSLQIVMVAILSRIRHQRENKSIVIKLLSRYLAVRHCKKNIFKKKDLVICGKPSLNAVIAWFYARLARHVGEVVKQGTNVHPVPALFQYL